MAVIRDRGLGLALKTLDGSMDVAAGGAVVTMLQRLKLLSEPEADALRPVALPPERNSRGEQAGQRFAIL